MSTTLRTLAAALTTAVLLAAPAERSNAAPS